MDRYCCPACGARGYRGNRCGECFYKPFGEEIAHGNHYHAGEPLILDTRPKALRPDRGCESYPGKRTPVPGFLKLLLTFLAIAAAIFIPGGIWIGLVILLINKAGKKAKKKW